MANEIMKFCIRLYRYGGSMSGYFTPVYYSNLAKLNRSFSGKEAVLIACIGDRLDAAR